MLVALNRPAHLHISVRDFDGVLVTSSITVDVSVRDAYDDVVASGSASPVMQGNQRTGEYTFNLPPAVTGNLGMYDATATWTVSGSTASVTYGVETVGQFLFEIADLRAFEPSITTNDYDALKVREARDFATDRLQNAAQVAFATRRRVLTLSGDDTTRLMVPDTRITKVNSASIYGEDIGTDLLDDDLLGSELADVEIDDAAGVLVRTNEVWPRGHENIVVDYEHGYEVTPGPVKRAAMMLAIEYLVPSALPARATAQATDLGDFRISLANPAAGRDTGIPEVDAVIATYGARRPRVA